MIETFVERLLQQAPELRPTYEKHIHDNREILSCILMADVGRYAADVCLEPKGKPWLVGLLTFLENELAANDSDVEYAIHAGFCEHFLDGRQAQEIILPLMGPRLREIMRNYPPHDKVGP